jgi:hypothetical protein
MYKLACAAFAFAAFGSVGHAMGGGPSRMIAKEPNLGNGGPFPSAHCITAFPPGMSQAQVNDLTEGMGPTNTSCLVSSPADCAPQGAEIVWGPHQELVGFSCYENANGG